MSAGDDTAPDSDPFGTTCTYCGLPIDDSTPADSYGTDANGDFLHYACSDPDEPAAAGPRAGGTAPDDELCPHCLHLAAYPDGDWSELTDDERDAWARSARQESRVSEMRRTVIGMNELDRVRSHAASTLRRLAGELRDGPPAWMPESADTSWRVEVASWLEHHAMRSDAVALRDPAQIVKASHDVRRAMYENGATEDVLKGWSAFAGWVTAGCPNEPDVCGPAGPVGMYPPAIDEADMERARRIAARAEDLPGAESVTVDLIESLYEEVMRLRPNAAAMRVAGDALADAIDSPKVAIYSSYVEAWRSVAGSPTTDEMGDNRG